MANEQPEFAKVEKLTRRQAFFAEQDRRDAAARARWEAELQQKADEKAAERERAQIAFFWLKVADTDRIPIVFHRRTGQVAVRKDALLKPGEARDNSYMTPRDYVRVRAADGLQLLTLNYQSYEPLSAFTKLADEFPPWMFEPTSEQPDDWRPIMQRVRWRAFRGAIAYGIKTLFEGAGYLIMGLIMLIVGGAVLAAMLYGAYNILEGVMGLLEFGRKQL